MPRKLVIPTEVLELMCAMSIELPGNYDDEGVIIGKGFTRRLEGAPIKAEHLLALDWILWRKREAMVILTEISMQTVRPQAAEQNISALSASTVNLNTNSTGNAEDEQILNAVPTDVLVRLAEKLAKEACKITYFVEAFSHMALGQPHALQGASGADLSLSTEEREDIRALCHEFDISLRKESLTNRLCNTVGVFFACFC